MEAWTFVRELSRRRVARVAAVYAAAVVAVLQTLDVAGSAFALPDATLPWAVALALAGFPVALVLGWMYDLSRRGIVRTRGAPSPACGQAVRPIHWLASVSVLAVATGALLGTAALSLRARTPEAGPVRTVAVLPLSDQTGDPAGSYFVEGMHDALIASLAGVDGLTVISRTSVLRYRDTERPLEEIARELGVDALVEGTVFGSAGSVAVTVQLVRVRPERHLWSSRYEGSIEQAIPFQRRVAESTARELAATLRPGEGAEAAAQAIDPAAQEAYLRGRALWRTRTSDGLARSVELLERAVEGAPGFAPAWAALADAYMVARGYGAIDLPHGEAYQRARDAAERALDLDPALPEAWAAHGFVYLQADRALVEAERSLRRAVRLNPSLAQAWAWLALVLKGQGRAGEAVEAAATARRLDPFAPFTVLSLGFALLSADRCPEALDHARTAAELNPALADPWVLTWRCRAVNGEEDGAVEALGRALEVWGASPGLVAEHHRTFHEGGWEAVLRWEIELFRSGAAPVRPEYFVAQRLALLGDLDGSLAALGEAAGSGDPLLFFEVRTDPLLADVRGDPRFDAWARERGLDR